MLPQARVRLCAHSLQRLCLRGEQRSRSAQKSKRKTAGNVSFGRFLAFYFCHQLVDRVIEVFTSFYVASNSSWSVSHWLFSANSLMLLPRLSNSSLTPSAFPSFMISEPIFFTC